MKKYSILILIALLSVISSAYAQKQVIRQLDDIDNVEVDGKNIHAVLIKSDKNEVVLRSKKVDYSKVASDQEGKKLVVKMKPGLYGDDIVDVEIYYKDINKVLVSGSAKVKPADTLKRDEFEIEATGSGEFTGVVDVPSLLVKTSISGIVNISGKVTDLSVNTATNGSFDGLEVEATNGLIQAYTNSRVKVNVSKKLEIKSVSKAKVWYRGTPAEVVKEPSMGGEIIGGLD